jgi:hypothetical protein
MLHIAATVSLAFVSLGTTEVDLANKLRLELSRFPSFEVADRCVKFGKAHQEWVVYGKNVLPHCEGYGRWLEEAEAYTKLWLWLRYVQNRSISVNRRLEALERFEELLGPQDWILGRMPLPPLSHFQDSAPSEAIIEEFKKNITALEPFIPKVEAIIRAIWVLKAGEAVGQITANVVPKMAQLAPFTKEQIAARLFLRKGMTERQVNSLIGRSEGGFGGNGGFFHHSYSKANVTIVFKARKVQSWHFAK